MNIVCRSRGAGKTTEMVRLVKKTGGVLITATQVEARRIRRDFNLNDSQVRCWSSYQRLSNTRNIPVYVDNAEWVLAHMLNAPAVEGVSFTTSGYTSKEFVDEPIGVTRPRISDAKI